MITDIDKFYGALFLFFSPAFMLIPAYGAAYAAKMCIGFKPELYLLWLIVALPVLVSYTRLVVFMPDLVYRLNMIVPGALYAYLFYYLTVPYVNCGWILGDLARASVTSWAIAVAVYYALHGVFRIPPSYIALLATSEFNILYLFYTWDQLLGYISQYV